MGKGDRKTKRGKISMGTFGVSRPRPSSKSNQDEEKKTKKAGKKKASASKSSKK